MKLNPALVAMIFAATGAASCAGVRSGQSDAAGLAAERVQRICTAAQWFIDSDEPDR